MIVLTLSAITALFLLCVYSQIYFTSLIESYIATSSPLPHFLPVSLKENICKTWLDLLPAQWVPNFSWDLWVLL